jgi:hypothetical protein
MSSAGVSPATALAVGLKVDLDALPQELRLAIQQGKVDLNSPATTTMTTRASATTAYRSR